MGALLFKNQYRKGETEMNRLELSFRCFLGCLSLIFCGFSQAANYVVLPLLGNQVTVVTAHMGTGSNLDRNEYTMQPLNDGGLDVAALRYADRAITQVDPSAKVVMLRASDA